MTTTLLNASEAYRSESPLPVGWPEPGPYNTVTLKQLPEYRAAYTDSAFQGFAFMRLFRHINRSEIPMTAPVEMALDASKNRANGMGFLYQSPEVLGGSTHEKISVQTIPAQRVLSYTWLGPDNAANREKAINAINTYAAEQNMTPGEFKLLGYNGPSVPRDKRTWEIHAVIAEE